MIIPTVCNIKTAIRELPDITELHCTQREYCNGGPPRPPPAPRLTPDSVSESSGTEPYRLGQRPRCVCLVLCVLAGAIAAGLGLPLALGGPGSRATQQQRLDIVKRLLQDVPLIDGHNDLPWNVRRFAHNRLAAVNLSGSVQLLEPWGKSPWSHTDIPRLRQGLLGAQFWSAYVPCGAQGLDAVQLALEQIDIIRRLVERHPRHLALATTTQGILDAHQNGRIASLIGVEGGHALGSSLAVLRALHALGARYLTITHSCDTSWAGSADSSLGLSVFGREIIREMNRIGMIVDLSHSSVQTSKDVLNSTYSPVIFSHSSSRALCNSTRNVPDDVLELVKDNDGLVMISFYSLLVACGRSSTSRDVIAHINHVRDVAGIEHVGLGAGYDGIDSTPSGLEDVSRYPHLLAELLEDSTWSEEDITKLAGGNLLRVFRAVEEVREQWRKAAVLPSEESEPPKRSDCAYMPS